MANLMDQLERKNTQVESDDPTASERKKDHIELAFQSQIDRKGLDSRFDYEPMLSGHPERGSLKHFSFLGKTLRAPMWVSSMTGGTELAHTINHNLARACQEYGMGMGLGSCRQLLYSDEYLKDFDVRAIIGEDLPLYANLGIAQAEQLAEAGELYRMKDLVDKLQADGLILHVNPLQEWLQPEGDNFQYPPLDTIQRVLEKADFPLIIKEVGQGFGRESIRALLRLPLAAIDFAANGGTNFARLELLRSDAIKQEIYGKLAMVGHSAEEMVLITNEIVAEEKEKIQCKEVIISGGVKDFLDGYYLIHKLSLQAIYGQASGFLRHARGTYEELQQYVESQVEGLELAQALLRVR